MVLLQFYQKNICGDNTPLNIIMNDKYVICDNTFW